MEKRELGKTGLKVSEIGFGSAPVGYLEEDQKRTATILNLLLDEGVNLIDTAACYPNSEGLIGKTIAPRRSEFYLVSKCGHQAGSLAGGEWSPELISKSIERSLRLLQTDHLDVMLLHSCDLSVLRQGDALAPLVKAKDDGKIRFIGYSGDNEAARFATEMEEIEVLETSVNICDQVNIEDCVQAAEAAKVGVLAKRPLANAAWKAPSSQRGIYQEYSAPYTMRLKTMDLDLSQYSLEAEEEEDRYLELALRFTLSVPGVHSALIGTTNPENARQNLEIAGKGSLSKEDFERLRSTFESERKRSSRSWEGLT